MALNLRPRELVDLRTSLVRWQETDAAANLWEHNEGEEEPIRWIFPGASTSEIQTALAKALGSSNLYLVDESMTPMCAAAGRDYYPERLSWKDFPAPFGLVAWNGQPIQRHTAMSNGELQDIVGVSWAIPLGRFEAGGDIQPLGVVLRVWEDRDGGTVPGGVDRSVLKTVLRRFVPLTESWLPFGAIDNDKMTTGPYEPALRVFLATLTLMTQRITRVTRERATRSDARRAARAGVDAGSDVSVVQLRSVENRDPEGHRDVAWSHRWVVSGHWRDQWYPSEQEHKKVWITPYVKGPDGLPVRVKERVRILNR